MRLTLAILVAAAALAGQAAPAATPAKPSTDLTGTWECSVSYQGQPIPVVLHLTQDNTKAGALTASMENVMEPGGAAVDASATFTDGALHVDVPSLPSSFDGKINTAGDSIDGSWSYNGDAVACTLTKDKPGN